MIYFDNAATGGRKPDQVITASRLLSAFAQTLAAVGTNFLCLARIWYMPAAMH